MSWQKELAENLHQLNQLESYFPDLVKDKRTSEELLSRYPMSIPTYYFSLIDQDNPRILFAKCVFLPLRKWMFRVLLIPAENPTTR